MGMLASRTPLFMLSVIKRIEKMMGLCPIPQRPLQMKASL
jgi:hypothetical protein